MHPAADWSGLCSYSWAYEHVTKLRSSVSRTQLPTIFYGTCHNWIAGLIASSTQIDQAYQHPGRGDHVVARICCASYRFADCKNRRVFPELGYSRSEANLCIRQRTCSAKVDGPGLGTLLFLGSARFRLSVSLDTGENDSGLKLSLD